MAEKRVSVRLAAVGGRQVRAEIDGVGEAGARGFGRLSREVEMANKRLAAFARRARLAAAAAAAATVAAGVVMVRSGLEAVDAQAKLAKSLETTVASVQVLERAGELAGVSMEEIEQSTLQLTRRLSMAAAGAGPAVKALKQLGLSAAELQAVPLDQRLILIHKALAEMVPAAERAAVASQLFGDRAGLVFTRIDGAALREARDELSKYGLLISQVDAAGVERANDAISKLGLIARGLGNSLAATLAPALEALAKGFAASFEATGLLGRALTALGDNLERIGTYGATFATFLAGRWVAGMAAAALSVRGLATTLVVLKGALIRTGIGLAVVAAGELVYWFSRLKSPTDALAASLTAVRDAVALEVDQIKSLARVVQPGTRLTLDAANAKLQEALAIRAKIAASVDEQRQIVLASEVWQQVQRDIRNYNDALGALRSPGDDIEDMPARLRDGYEELEAGLVTALQAQQALLAAIDPLSEEYQAASEAIETLQAGIAAARDGQVILGQTDIATPIRRRCR